MVWRPCRAADIDSIRAQLRASRRRAASLLPGDACGAWICSEVKAGARPRPCGSEQHALSLSLSLFLSLSLSQPDDIHALMARAVHDLVKAGWPTEKAVLIVQGTSAPPPGLAMALGTLRLTRDRAAVAEVTNG